MIVFMSQAGCGGTKAAEKHWLQSRAPEKTRVLFELHVMCLHNHTVTQYDNLN